MANKDFSKISNNWLQKNECIIYYALSKCPWVFDDEDLMQDARIWLCIAKTYYKKNKGASWKTFASNFIKQEYSRVFNKVNRKKTDPELNGFSNVGIDSINENDLFILDANIKKVSLENIENSIIYDKILDCIKDKREKEIVILYSMGYGPTDIAKRYNITKQRVWQIYKKAIDGIKAICKEE